MRPSSCRTRVSATACLPASTRPAPPSRATSCAIRRATLSNSRFEPDAPGTCRATTSHEEVEMPPRGVKKGTKLARQYEHIKESERSQGRSEERAEKIAARTVNKERARSGEAKTSSRLSKTDMSSSRRGGLRSGTNRAKGRTYEQLYNEARRMGIEGRSSMNKAQLQRAVDSRK